MVYYGDLYHHGIKGQKWGIRRYQNEDGSLTAEGKERYGKSLGEYGTRRQGVIRRLTTGDWLLGRKRIGEYLEDYYGKKATESKRLGRNQDYNNFKAYQKAQRQRNIDREKYTSNASTGKLFVQRFLLTSGAHTYWTERQNQVDIGKAMASGIVTYIPYVGLIGSNVVDAYQSKKRYGKITI